MITIDFGQRGGTGLCEFLCTSLRAQISGGILKADEKLPSKRALAAHLGVSVITVQNAYEQLIGEGYIYSIEKKGFFVTDIAVNQNRKADNAPDGAPGDYATPAIGRAPITHATPPARACQKQSCFFDFRNNAPNVERFPFSQWAHVMRGVLSGGDGRLLERQGMNGVLELRQAIAGHLNDFRGMSVSPGQIVIGAGTEYLYSLLVQFFGRGKTFAVENPGYHKVAAVFGLNGAAVRPIAIDQQGIQPALLRKNGIDIAHVSPAHHFPTGIVMPIRRRLELLAWADEEPGRFILEDDYDSEFRFNGKPLPTLQSTSKSGTVIYLNTFSKTIAPSFRIGYLVLPPELVEPFQKKLGFYSCPVSAFEQFTLASFISDGLYETHLIRMKNYYRNLRNTLIRALEASRFAGELAIREEEAGLHFLISFKSGRSGDELKQAFSAQGLNLPLLSEFYYQGELGASSPAGAASATPELFSPAIAPPAVQPGFPMQNTFVINYSAVQKENIPEIVRRMEKALE